MCPSVTPGDDTTTDKHVSSSGLERDSSSNPLGPLIQITVNSKVVTPISLSPHSKPSKETVKGVRQTVVNLADRIATYSLGLGGESLMKEKQFVYLLSPFDVPLQLDTNKTLGKVFLGSLGVKLNTFFKRNLWFTISITLLWLVSVIVSLLSIIAVLPQDLSWTMTLTLPALMFSALLMQYDIVVDLYQRFSTRYCFGNSVI